jgi:hypothetical protein
LASERKAIDITDVPALLRIAREVQETKEATLLRDQGQDVALLVPVDQDRAKASHRGRRMRPGDSLSRIIGIGESHGPTDISSNKHKYLADAYAPKRP